MTKTIPARAMIDCILCAGCGKYATATGGGICEACTLRAENERLRGEKSWRCYHCGQVFTDAVLAAEHFGDDRNSPRPAHCEGMLDAYARTFEHYGIHRNHHNAASVKQLAQQRDAALTRAESAESALAEERARLDWWFTEENEAGREAVRVLRNEDEQKWDVARWIAEIDKERKAGE